MKFNYWITFSIDNDISAREMNLDYELDSGDHINQAAREIQKALGVPFFRGSCIVTIIIWKRIS